MVPIENTVLGFGSIATAAGNQANKVVGAIL
jgi:hypothetical protein